MKAQVTSKILLFGLFSLLSPLASADVVINEIGAATSNRALRYLADGRPRLGYGPGWQDPKFDAQAWETGSLPIGFGFATPATDLKTRMVGKAMSLYLRKTFTVSAEDAARAEPLRLQAFFDDGFIAFVNGVEIARGNLAAKNSYIYHDSSAFNKHTTAQATKEYVFPTTALAKDLLMPGENVLAIQVQNTIPSDLDENVTTDDATLRFEGKLYLGPGATSGGLDIPLADSFAGWRYFLGVCEPSGGVADVELASATTQKAELVDWIELHNNGASEVDLSGWTLSDEQENPKTWAFPAGTKIAAGGYLLVLADGYEGTAKGRYLHANFKLETEGAYLGLYDASGKVISEFADEYPKQDFFHTYGIKKGGGGYVYFSEPTPGGANDGPELADVVSAPNFSVAGGFYDGPVELKLETKTVGATIRYTTNGSTPTETNGQDYAAPIAIAVINNKTATVIRARAFLKGSIPSKIETQSYLVGQDPALKTIPAISLVGDAEQVFYKPFGITSIQGSTTAETWTPKTIDDYYYPRMHGRAYEKKTSMEILYGDPKQGENIQIDMGLRIAASPWSRLRYKLRSTQLSPWTSTPEEKPSLNFFFRSEYGNSRLEAPVIPGVPVRSFEYLRIRAGKNEIGNPFIRDELGRRLFTDMGYINSVGIHNSIYVNGVFKGFFNMVTRLREGYLQDCYGSDKPWDVRVIQSWASGDNKAYLQFETAIKKDLKIQENYDAALKMIDINNFVDYLIFNIWGATWDWPQNNFIMSRERSDTGIWRCHVWDCEGIMGHTNAATWNTITSDLQAKPDPVPTIYKRFILNPEFKVLFADRLQKQFFSPSGALTDQNIARRIEELKAEVGPIMNFSLKQKINVAPLTAWITSRPKQLFPVGKQLEKAGLWPATQTVIYNQQGGTVSAGFSVTMTAGTEAAPQAGDIFYTLDGSDPRLPLGAVNPTAKPYERGTPIVLQESGTLRARVKNGDLWSPVNDASFLVGYVPANGENILVTEIMYKPAEPDAQEAAAGYAASDFEYIEIYNTSSSGVDLAGLHFAEGIEHDFTGAPSRISAQGYGLLVANREAFLMRYGAGLPIVGVFRKELSNGGETLVIQDATYRTIREFAYSDGDLWPAKANDAGHSLVLKAPDAKPDLNDPLSWADSKAAGGSPGKAEEGGQPVDLYQAWRAANFTNAEMNDLGVSGPNGDADGDRAINFSEYAFGSQPKNSQSSPLLAVEVRRLQVGGKQENYLVVTSKQRSDDSKLSYRLEVSQNLTQWEPSAFQELSRQAAGPGLVTVQARGAAPLAGHSYVRLRAQQ